MKRLVENIEKIHDLTLGLLEKHGITMDNEDAIKTFKKNGAHIENNRVFIPRLLIEASLQSIPSEFELKARNPVHNIRVGLPHKTLFGPSAGVLYVLNKEGHRIRGTMNDLENFHKLSHSSDFCDISCAGLLYPESTDPQKILYEQMMSAIRFSDKSLLGLTNNKKIAEDTIEMARIATQSGEGHYVMGIVNSLSPMSWDENMLDAIKIFAEKNQPLVIACCSMAGFTSHISLEGTLVSNNAEILSGLVYSQLIRPGAPVIYGNTSAVSDMRTVGLAIGAPETAVISTAACQLARYYGVPFRSGGGLSDAKDLDAQAGIEATTNLMFTMANKVDVAFHSLGILESFNTISYQKWIMDEEILARIFVLEKEMNGFSDSLIDVIGEVGTKNYLEHPDTMKHFREAFFLPKVSDRFGYSTWEARGIDIKSKTNQLVEKRLRDYQEPVLDITIAKALNQFLEHA